MAQLQARWPIPAWTGVLRLWLLGAALSVGDAAQAQQHQAPPPADLPSAPPAATQVLPQVSPQAARPAPRRPLDLRAPDIRRIVPAAALREPLPAEGDDVTIESRREPPSDPARQPVPGGIAAPFWAIRHPTQAWRIFAPDPNTRAADPPDPVPKRKP